MIKEIYIEIRGHRTNFEHFKRKGYDIQFKKPIQVKIEDLMPGSTTIITSICDNCGVEKRNEFRFYYEYTEGLKEKYFCNKCNNIKRKETCLEKWGFENPMQSEEIKDKLKRSLLDTYGVDHFSKTEEFKEKYKDTCLKNFGVDNTFKSTTHKEKIKKSNLEKFGVEYPQQNIGIKEKTTKSFINRYGVKRYSQTSEFKSKI